MLAAYAKASARARRAFRAVMRDALTGGAFRCDVAEYYAKNRDFRGPKRADIDMHMARWIGA